jgi:hypothetical protein
MFKYISQYLRITLILFYKLILYITFIYSFNWLILLFFFFVFFVFLSTFLFNIEHNNFNTLLYQIIIIIHAYIQSSFFNISIINL